MWPQYDHEETWINPKLKNIFKGQNGQQMLLKCVKVMKDKEKGKNWKILKSHNSQNQCRILVHKKNNRKFMSKSLQFNSVASIFIPCKIFIIIWNVNIRKYWVKWELSVVFSQLSVSLKLCQKLYIYIYIYIFSNFIVVIMVPKQAKVIYCSWSHFPWLLHGCVPCLFWQFSYYSALLTDTLWPSIRFTC